MKGMKAQSRWGHKRQGRLERKRRMRNSRRRIAYRLREREWEDQAGPMFRGCNVRYEIAARQRGLSVGGIGLIHQLVRARRLPQRINERLKLFKRHQPYWESDHVLNIAYNSLLDGSCLEDIELRRNDETFLDSLGAQRIPDPTTAGDFCRRFKEEDVEALQEAINDLRVELWREQPEEFRELAIIDGDGTLAATRGECKQGMDVSYNGVWGYHPLVVSLANTQEPLYLRNRSGSRPSHEGAFADFDRSIALARRAGFRRVLLRGDTDFSQTTHLDRWDAEGVEFIFGYDARKGLQEQAAALPSSAWVEFVRPAKYEVKTEPRQCPENVKARIVKEREFQNQVLNSEDVAEFEYRPANCRKAYRMVVLRKNLSVEKGEKELFDDVRYFFFITNRRDLSAAEVLLTANERCNQENLIEQLKNGVRALSMPVDNLVSNWAYMVMAALAWTLKAWLALSLPEAGRWREKYKAEKESLLRMEFKRFVNGFVRLPAQLVKTGRRLVFRLLSWNPYQHIFLRLVERFEPQHC